MTETTFPILSVTGARMRFGEVRALDGVDLAVFPGECVGLVDVGRPFWCSR